MRLSQIATALVAVASLTGCASERWVDFAYISEAPPSVLMGRERMEIPAGLAVGVRATPIEDGERTADFIDLVPVRPGIIGIDHGLEDEQWVIFGISPGATSVELWFSDELVGELSAVVTEQHVRAND